MAVRSAEEWIGFQQPKQFACDLGQPSTRSWAEQTDDLLALRNLEDDWDGQGAEAPEPGVVDAAVTLAQSLRAKGVRPADFVVAGVNGTVIFEWHGPTYLEIEVTSPAKAEGRWVRKGSEETEVFTLSRRS